jgi:cardiolipin hydrolase
VEKSLKKGSIAAIFFIFGIVIGSISSYTITSKQINALQDQVESLKNDKEILQDEIASLQKDKANLENRVSELEAKNVAIDGEPIILAVRFSPKGGAASQVIYWIGRANESIHILIYSFTLDSIGDAILSAYHRGVDIKIVFEKSQISKYSEYFRLAEIGVQVRNDTNPNFMHHKVAIIDGYIVLIGSFNWTDSADEENNEDLLVIRSHDLASDLEQEFQRIWNTGR